MPIGNAIANTIRTVVDRYIYLIGTPGINELLRYFASKLYFATSVLINCENIDLVLLLFLLFTPEFSSIDFVFV